MAILNAFRNRYALLSGIISFVCLLYGENACAHVTWFVANEGKYADSRFIPDLLSFAIALGAVCYLLFAGWLESRSRTEQPQSLLYSPLTDGRHIYTTIQISVAILLLGNIIQGHFIAPNIPFEHHSLIEPLLQATLILLMILNGDLFSIAMLGVCFYLINSYGLNIAVDYIFELAAIAVALIFSAPNSRMNKNLTSRLGQAWALTALRVGLGLQLCVLTIHDKLSHPGLALQFLADYPYFNFIKKMGFEGFENIYFVLGAGLAEFCFGFLLLTNIAQRLSSLCICFFFGLTGVVLGPAELLGHVPILTIAIVLLLNPAPSLRSLLAEGYGSRGSLEASRQELPE